MLLLNEFGLGRSTLGKSSLPQITSLEHHRPLPERMLIALLPIVKIKKWEVHLLVEIQSHQRVPQVCHHAVHHSGEVSEEGDRETPHCAQKQFKTNLSSQHLLPFIRGRTIVLASQASGTHFCSTLHFPILLQIPEATFLFGCSGLLLSSTAGWLL